jgi:hypothetical protein
MDGEDIDGSSQEEAEQDQDGETAGELEGAAHVVRVLSAVQAAEAVPPRLRQLRLLRRQTSRGG